MPACAACGTANPPQARFCLACGAALESVPRQETRRTVTVVFSDVVGSTALGERLDAEALRALMSRFFDAMRAALEAHGGTVEKFIGDAVMAVFGVPQVREDDALRAVRGAMEMTARLNDLNVDLIARFGTGLQARTGVNTGEVVAGDLARGESFVAGDAVNVAARLEQSAAPGEILLGADTLALVRDAVRVEAVEPLRVKGKTDPVNAVRLTGLRADALDGIGRRLDAELVGRTSELEQLMVALERARRDRTCVLTTVIGPAGIGKSRLAKELLRRVAGSAVVLEGRCLPYGEGITFWPLAEVLKAAAGIGEREPRDEAEGKLRALIQAGEEDAETVLDRVAAVIGLREANAEPGELFWATRRVLESLSRDKPLVVVFDDIHWAEPTFLDFVEYLASFSRGAPVLVLCLSRPELLEVRPGWGSMVVDAVTLRVEPLGPAEARRLMENALGGASVPDEVADHVAAIAEGNALFVEGLARMLVSDGILRREQGRWMVTRPLADVEVPATIQALLAARLERLAAPERGVLERGSVIGHVFWWGAVSELSPPASRPDVPRHLQALARRELIRPDESTFAGEDAFRFGHVLIRDAAYRGILRDLRSELHERFAVWLERRVDGRVEEYEEIIGYHLEQAFRQQEALGIVDPASRELATAAARRLASAGRRAGRRGDMPATANLLGRALDLFAPDEPERLELMPDLAEALIEVGELARGRILLDEALALARQRGDELLEWRLRLQRADLESTVGTETLADSLLEAERAVEAFQRLGSPGDSARAWAIVGRYRGWLGEADRGLEACERAVQFAREAGDGHAENAALEGLLLGCLIGSTPAAAALQRCAEVLASPTAARRQRAFAHGIQAPFLAMVGRFDDARAAGRRAREMLEELGLHVLVAGESGGSALAEMLAGRPDLAERRLRSGRAVLEPIGAAGFLSTNLGQLAEAVYAQGRHEEADALAEECRRVATEDDIDPQARWRRVRAKVLAGRGMYREAETLAREAVAMLDGTDYVNDHADALVDLAEVLRLAGRPSEATPITQAALALYERKGNQVSSDLARRTLLQMAST